MCTDDDHVFVLFCIGECKIITMSSFVTSKTSPFSLMPFRLSDTQECLETSLIEKENTLVKTSEKLELIDSLRDSLKEKEAQHKEVSDKLLQSENNVSTVACFGDQLIVKSVL